jgi:hypothetical protein
MSRAASPRWLIAVVRVHQIRPRLVYRADRDINAVEISHENVVASEETANWIATSISARVERVLKASPTVSEGSPLTFEEEGGTSRVRGVEVVATVPWFRPMSEGKRYLIFGFLTLTGRLLRTAVYEEPSPNALLVSVGPQDGEERLETYDMESALTLISGVLANR